MEGATEPWGALAGVVVGRVVEAVPHPDADRLTVCKVDAGGEEPLQVVCGAPNVRAGSDYAFAPVGIVLPATGRKLRKARIRGQSSRGMLCSPKELGLGDDHTRILSLDSPCAPGESFVRAAGLDDLTLDVEVTANRGDLLSHVGIARELARQGDGSVIPTRIPMSAAPVSPRWKTRTTKVAHRSASGAGLVDIAIQEPELCTRYVGAVVRGVQVGPSPDWLRRRLIAAGSRPVNNVVDSANHVLLELGHPLHAFDLDALAGPSVVVRRPGPGETSIRTLDGETRRLEPSMLAICDRKSPVAIAGVIGGLESAVSESTTNVLLECALFDPKSIRATRQTLGLSTDASYRFERGVDPDGVTAAVERVLELVLTTAGGELDGPALDCEPVAYQPVSVVLRLGRIETVLGIAFERSEVSELLSPLGFVVGAERDGRVRVQVPGFRSNDVTREIDVIEEIARSYGYDRFPDELGPYRPSAVPDHPAFQLEDRLRDDLRSRGLTEVQSPAFVSESEGEVRLAKPVTEPEPMVRRDILPSVLRTVERNLALGNRDLRFFEIATSFALGVGAAGTGRDGSPAERPRPREETRLAAAFVGRREPRHWSSPKSRFGSEAEAEMLNLWDLKGLLQEIAASAWGDGARLRPATSDGTPGVLAPLHSFEVSLGTVEAGSGAEGSPLGWGGLVRRERMEIPEWADPIWGLEIALPAQPVPAPELRVVPVSRYPASERDLALTVPDRIAHGQVRDLIEERAGPLLERLELFDLYRGVPMRSDERSLAYRLRFRSPKRTLRDPEVDRYVSGAIKALKEELGVEPRS